MVTRYVLLFALALITACQSIPPGGAPSAPPAAVGELAWKNAEWDRILLAEIRAQGLTSVASLKDAGEFCPGYSRLDPGGREEFWAVLMVAMAKRESGWKPGTTYKEAFSDARGNPVISAGLFQISPESASSKAYGCGTMTAAMLVKAEPNIVCSTRILARWVKTDGYVGSKPDGYRGGARYWSVLRPASSSRPTIITATRKVPGCGG